MSNREEVQRAKGQRRRLILLGLAFAMLLAGVVGYRICFPTHPQFGAIYEVRAVELNNPRASTPLARYLRQHLPRRVVESRYFPSRFRDEAR